MTQIQTIERKSRNTLDDVLAIGIPGQILATDFYLDGAEEWDPVPGGLAHPAQSVINVDHHAPLPQMQRRVSSTNLALEHLQALSTVDRTHSTVIINHMDCDSVLASGILSGRLDPDPAYGESAIAADHTGREDPVADLLQGLDAHWSRNERPMANQEGLEFFFECLRRFEAGVPLDGFAQEALDVRKKSRERAERIVAEGGFMAEAGVYFARLDDPLEGELLMPFLPEATMVVTTTPHQSHPDRHRMKIRLGLGAQEGVSLHALGIQDFDSAYGGRWNAGSNNRGDGTDLDPEDYRQRLVTALRAI
jgi:hypothetical protein